MQDHDDQDHNAPLTVEQILAEWKAERPAIEREMAEREARLKRDEMLDWCKQQADARQADTIPKDYAAPAKRTHAPVSAPAPAVTQEWQRYCRLQLDRRDRIIARAIGQSIGANIIELERSNAALVERVAKLEAELAELKDRAPDTDARRLRLAST